MRVAHARKRKPADYKRIVRCVVYLALLGVLWGVWFGYLGRKEPEAVAGAVVGSSRSAGAGHFQDAGASTAEVAKGTVESVTPLKLSYAIIREDLSSLRARDRKKYAAMLKGKRVRWAGWVSEIKEDRRKGFQLCVDMDVRSDPDKHYDVIFSISPDDVVTLGVDRPIIFEGTITSISLDGNCIITLDKAIIMRAVGG